MARSLGLATVLLSAPLAADYLGHQRYGIFLMLLSLNAVIAFSDLGVGNGLVGRIANAEGMDDRMAARRAVTAGALIIGGLGCAVAVLFAVLDQAISFPRLLGVDSGDAREAHGAVRVWMVCFVLALIGSLPQRVYLAHQEASKMSIWLAAGNTLALAGIVIAASMKAGVSWLVLAASGGPALTALISGAVLFVKKPWLRPHIDRSIWLEARVLLRLGSLFFALGIATVVGYESDALIIAKVLGVEQVPQYTLPLRIFTVAPIALGFAYVALWPAYAEAIARGDLAWVRRALRRSVVAGATVAVPVGALLTFAGPKFLSTLSADIRPSFSLLLALAVWSTLSAVGGAVAVFFNAAGVVRAQVLMAVSMASVNLPLSVALAHAVGVSGVVWGSVTSVIVCIGLPSLFLIPHTFRRLECNQG